MYTIVYEGVYTHDVPLFTKSGRQNTAAVYGYGVSSKLLQISAFRKFQNHAVVQLCTFDQQVIILYPERVIPV